jgi:hypothetical protein
MPDNMTDEQKYYFNNNISTSWIFSKEGKIIKKKTNRAYID